jgi:kynureninase
MSPSNKQRPSSEELKKLDQEDELNWTRGKFEIPTAKACGADVGE